MLRPTRLLLVCSLLTLCTLSLALGQEVRRDLADNTQIITASVARDGVRIAAPSAVVQLRLQVYDDAGQKLFDTEQRGGNVLDWHLQGGAGERVADGTYLGVVTIKNPSGRLSQKLLLVTVSAQSTTLRPAGVAELSVRQAQVVGLIEGEDEGLAVMPAEDAQPVTVLAHTGDEAQLTRTRGALSFRVGDFFSANDKEQMRLTQEGNLGIGTTKPKVKLDVAGMIRAREGFAFSNGSTLNVSDKGALTLTSSNGSVVPNVSGTGTQNQIAKWTANLGELGDSTITEVGGRVGIGVTNPTYKLVVGPDLGPGLTTSDLTISRGPGQSVSIFAGATGAHGMNFGWDEANQRAFVNAPVQSPITFTNGGVSERMRIAASGNVGIGTSNPAAKLEVAGDVKLSGANSGLLFPDGTKMTTAAAGGTPSGTSIVSAVNDAVTTGTINDNRLSPNLARLNSANTFTGNQSVNGDISTRGPTAQLNVSGGAIITCGNVAAPCLNVENNTLTVEPSTQNVGIGVGRFPSSKLTVAGAVQSTSGGFVFPDGSTQTGAAGQGFTKVVSTDLEISPAGRDTVISLDLPPGTYLVTASIQFENTANLLFQNNSRLVSCLFFPISQTEPGWLVRLGAPGNEADKVPLTFTSIFTLTGTFHSSVSLLCAAQDGGIDRSYVLVKARRLTAVRLGGIFAEP